MNKIEKIVIQPVIPNRGLIGFVSFVLDGKLQFSSIGLHVRMDESGYRLTYPTKKVGDRTFTLFNPLTHELSKDIETAVFAAAKQYFG